MQQSPAKASAASSQQHLMAVKQYEQKVIAIVKRFPDGVTDQDMKKEFQNQQIRVIAVNNLVQSGRIQAYQTQGSNSQVIYKEVSPEEMALFQGLSAEDKTIYDLIKQSGNKGAWLKDIRYKSKIQPKAIQASLKKLKAKEVIKSVKTIHGKNKIVYMLNNLEPSKEITGGAWYSGTDFNTQLIEDLQKAICDFISHKKHCSAKEALEHVRKLGITGEQELQLEDLQTVIDTLVYDALLEKHFEPRLNHEVYMFASVLTPENSFSTIPCSTCPVFEQCTDQGDINPQTCPYLTKWLQYNVDDGLNS